MNWFLQQKTLIAALVFAVAVFSIETAVNVIEISPFSSEEDSSSSSEEDSSSSSEQDSSSSVESSSSLNSGTYRLRLALPLILIDESGKVIKDNEIFRNSSLLVIVGIYNSGTKVFSGKISVMLENDVNSEIIEKKNVITVPKDGRYHLFDFYTSKINSASGSYKINVYYEAESGERMVSNYSSYQNSLDLQIVDATSPIIAKDFSLTKIPINASVQIYDLKGKLITGTLPPGVYLVKIKGEKFSLNKKIVVRP